MEGLDRGGDGEGGVVDWYTAPPCEKDHREKGRADRVNGEGCAHQECRDVSAGFIYTRHAVGKKKTGAWLGAASADCCCSSAGAINNAAAPPCRSADLTMRTCITFELRFCFTSARVRRHA